MAGDSSGSTAPDAPAAMTGVKPGPVEQCPEVRADSEDESKQRACGGSCESASCSAGPCTPELLLTETDTLIALLVDGDDMFYSKRGSSAVVWLSGGEVKRNIDVHGEVQSLSKLDNWLYFATRSSDNRNASTLGSVELPGDGEPSTQQLALPVSELAVTPRYAYLTDFNRGVKELDMLDHGFHGDPRFLIGWQNASGIFVQGDTLWWTQLNLDNSIRSMQLSTRQTELIACNQEWPTRVVSDGSRVYWTNRYIYSRVGRLMVKSPSDAAPRVLLDGLTYPGALAVDDTFVYWTEETRLLRLRK